MPGPQLQCLAMSPDNALLVLSLHLEQLPSEECSHRIGSRHGTERTNDELTFDLSVDDVIFYKVDGLVRPPIDLYLYIEDLRLHFHL